MFGPRPIGACVIPPFCQSFLVFFLQFSATRCLYPSTTPNMAASTRLATKTATSRAQSGKKNAATSSSAPRKAAGNNKTKTQKTTSSGKAQSPPISPEEMAELRQLREQLKAKKMVSTRHTSASEPDHERKLIILCPNQDLLIYNAIHSYQKA